jgi:hypothetical protein
MNGYAYMRERRERMAAQNGGGQHTVTQGFDDPDRIALREAALAHIRGQDRDHDARLARAEMAREIAAANQQAGREVRGMPTSFLSPQMKARIEAEMRDGDDWVEQRRPDGSVVLVRVERPKRAEEVWEEARMQQLRAQLPSQVNRGLRYDDPEANGFVV